MYIYNKEFSPVSEYSQSGPQFSGLGQALYRIQAEGMTSYLKQETEYCTGRGNDLISETGNRIQDTGRGNDLIAETGNRIQSEK